MKKLIVLLAMSISSCLSADITTIDLYAMMKSMGKRPTAEDAIVAIALATNNFEAYKETMDFPPIKDDDKAALTKKLLAIISPQITPCKERQTQLTDALVVAVRKKDFAAVQEALSKGPNVDGQYSGDPFGHTPLIASIRYPTPNNQITLYLLTDGHANPNATDKLGWTPLMAAALGREVSIVDILLSSPYCADTTVVNKDGQTALVIAEKALSDAIKNKTSTEAILKVIDALKTPPCSNKR